MHLRFRILLSATTLAFVILSPHYAVAGTPANCIAPARAAALVAWKPRPWTPASGWQWSNGLWISIDPVDGARGMPSTEQLEQLGIRAGEPIADDAPVLIEHLPDGTITAHLDDRWANFAMVRIGADGKPGWQCVDGRWGMARYMAQPPVDSRPATVQREDK